MKTAALDKKTIGFGLSAAVMSIANTLLVITKESAPVLKKSMAAAMGHHWTTHGAIVIVLFVVLGVALSGAVKPESWSADTLGKTILISVALGVAALAGFYLVH